MNISQNKIQSDKISNKVLCGKVKWVKNELIFIGKDLLNSKKLNDKLILIKIKDSNAKINVKEYNVIPQCFNVENEIVDIQYIDDTNLLILAIKPGGNKLALYKFNKNKYTINQLNEEKLIFKVLRYLIIKRI
ncbi:hypothetical protein CBCST_06183 [Clostridium botulinum C str. Stockholm]|nr:hypothetical protein CBCST_06183 [Clostridium botulinum C str. Stockholm]